VRGVFREFCEVFCEDWKTMERTELYVELWESSKTAMNLYTVVLEDLGRFETRDKSGMLREFYVGLCVGWNTASHPSDNSRDETV